MFAALVTETIGAAETTLRAATKVMMIVRVLLNIACASLGELVVDHARPGQPGRKGTLGVELPYPRWEALMPPRDGRIRPNKQGPARKTGSVTSCPYCPLQRLSNAWSPAWLSSQDRRPLRPGS